MKYFIVLILLCIAPVFTAYSVEGQMHYEIIYIIHGDADYLFHDTSGASHYADTEILKQALEVAKYLDNSEVFVFHQGPASKFLFFPQDDSHFYYFSNGKRVKEDSYTRDNSDSDLTKEIYLFNQYRNKDNAESQKILLYYGHEIPSKIGNINAYNESHPDINFNEEIFSNSVKKFAGKNKFDLIVLSTCNNGTPGMVSLLSPYTKYLVASPENLHLSQMNSTFLKELNKDSYDPYSFAYSFAQNAFNHLKQNTLTVITISLYDVEKTRPYLRTILGNNTDNTGSQPETAISNCDCNSIKYYLKADMENGVTVFYNPPAFGKNKNKKSHSGWGCKQKVFGSN